MNYCALHGQHYPLGATCPMCPLPNMTVTTGGNWQEQHEADFATGTGQASETRIERYLRWWRLAATPNQPDWLQRECEAFVLAHVLAGLVVVGAIAWAVTR